MSSLAHVLDQHIEEAAFLGLLRTLAVREPHYDLAHLTTLDNRIEAHLDGLRVAGEAGLEALLGQLRPHAEGEVFAATVLAFETGASAALTRLAEHLRSHPHGERFMAAALGWLEWPQVAPWIDRLLGSPEPVFRRIGLAACGLHRHDPGAALLAGLSQADPGVIAGAARTAGVLRRRDLMAPIRTHRLHPDPATRFWANWATAQMGDEEALDVLRQFAEQPGPWQTRALPVLLAWQPRDQAISWVRGLMQQEALRRMVIQAVGILGGPLSLPWLIQQMYDVRHARVAGEAFSLITGADLALLDLERREAPDYDAGPNDNPEDENVDMDPDENLPWPTPEAVEAWWQKEKDRWQNGQPYLLGNPLNETACQHALRHGQQRQRSIAAIQLARLHPTAALFPVDAPAWRQRRLLGA